MKTLTNDKKFLDKLHFGTEVDRLREELDKVKKERDKLKAALTKICNPYLREK